MENQDAVSASIKEVFNEFWSQPNAYRSLLILVASIILSYWASKYIAKLIIFIAQKVAVRSDSESDTTKAVRLRQVETYLGVAVAVIRVVIVAIAAYVVWRTLSPEGSTQLGGSAGAAIGASAIFIVIAGQTVGTLLRDITAGATMIAEQWFNVGDYIKVEPFWDVKGVVERLTLRSTRIRSISGEIIIIHNQKIDAVHVTPNGVRSIAVEVFVNDQARGEKFVKRAINSLPIGPTMLATPPRITESSEWTDDVWRIKVEGQTTPGRDWLLDTYLINSLQRLDEAKPAERRLLADPPIAHWADDVAERRFTRAVRVKDKQDS